LTVTQRYRFVYKPLVFIASLLPLAWMICGAAGWFGASLGVDPVKRLEHECGKTALNLPGGKNQVGTVTQPAHVAIAPHVLRSLPRRDIVSGYGEMLKYGLALDAPLYYALRYAVRILGTPIPYLPGTPRGRDRPAAAFAAGLDGRAFSANIAAGPRNRRSGFACARISVRARAFAAHAAEVAAIAG